MDGEMISEQFIDGKIQSLSVNDSGEMFLTKRVKGEDSIVYRCVTKQWISVISVQSFFLKKKFENF